MLLMLNIYKFTNVKHIICMDDVLEYSDGGKTVRGVKDKSVKTIVIP